MLDLATRFIPLARSRSLRAAGLAWAAGTFMALSGGAASARAEAPDWGPGCTFSVAPQGYGDMMRYSNCSRQNDCRQIANAAGHTVFGAGCFGVAPDRAPAPAAVNRAPARR